jgi:AAA domain-containing protein
MVVVMTYCPICGADPCRNPQLCSQCRKTDQRLAPRDHIVEALGSWRNGLITAKDLQTKVFAPVRIILPGLIPEGVTILAGKPKIGKSWLALDICAAIAGDRLVLGEIKPVQGDVLYLALEDNQRRLKKRTDKILQGAGSWPESLEIHTQWRRTDQGGLDDLREWCESHPGRRLIWIDTFTKIRPLSGRNEQAYAFDYRSIEGLQKLAGEYQVGIVLNHHLRKAASEDDAFDDVSGTLGLTGAADTIIILKRYSGMVKVFVRGRDIEEAEFAAEFNRETCRWRLVGEADEVFRSEQRQAIAAALKDAKRPMSVSEIMAATERRDRNSTEVLLHRMEKNGEVKHVGRGLWADPDPTADPLDPSKIGKKVRSANQPFDDPIKIDTDESYCDLTDAETSKIPSKISKNAKPLKDSGKTSESYFLTDLTGSEHPPQAVVWIKEVWPPAISAGPDDDIFDIDPQPRPRWMQ